MVKCESFGVWLRKERERGIEEEEMQGECTLRV